MTPTALPEFRSEYKVTPIDTTAKTTQGKVFFNYYAAKDFTLHLHYQVLNYKAGDKVSLEPCKGGFGMLDGYRCHIIDFIEADGVKTKTYIVPTDWITRRQFCIVREYKTTIWEIT